MRAKRKLPVSSPLAGTKRALRRNPLAAAHVRTSFSPSLAASSGV
jgi:hypothetical protein